jgi:carbamate kinase
MIPDSGAAPRDDRTIVVALGGNALQPEGERGDIHQQFRHTRGALGAIVDLAGKGWRIAIVHGNGPQIGDALVREEFGRAHAPPLPLGVLVAATAGWIGYMIQQSLQNALENAGVTRSVVTLITQIVVDRDAALDRPTKPIGRTLDEARARSLADDAGWSIAPAGKGWRRMVPSPVPLEIVEAGQIRRLVESDTIVIAAGGGGTPVYRDPVLRLEGVDAVIDKDRAAEVLAEGIGAAVLLILTNVDGVYRAFGTPGQELLRNLSAAEAGRMLADGEFGEGSMGPKVEAALEFIARGGKRAIIGRLDQGLSAVQGETGTAIVP